ncbi:hypothetical protein K505DRAFT_88701 [Melanomma pulvis-pyrius CBS 109.77]|uniref:Sin3 binding protein-domain-containing protein n=1 Tax=Melanomma pulvis-pyrius CBS 109.77 TaxID=1314802 RepID=A0A6A6X0V3_9PLEO|nr:hypothetical protein K505DRAFT_88701 [Melanomma pulvis-pyrius CBS 109.77]
MATAPTSKPVSNIAVAFAAQSATSNIPIPYDGSHAAAPAHPGMPPTPPSSMSPSLLVHKHRPGMPGAARSLSENVDMDIDLQDAVEHAAAQDQPAAALSREALSGLDATRQITAIMLAKHHLPAIILGHGAMPIREMMAHLTQSVPGFSRLAPSKARRLIVAALEHRAGGGLNGEVKFEKVGWGRWSVAGQSSVPGRGVPIGTHNASHSGPTPPASVDSVGGLQIPKNMRNHNDIYSGSWAAGSTDSSRDEEMADRMSLDGSEASDSDASEMDLEDDLDDDTDQEDWAAIGPETLRDRPHGHMRTKYRDYNYLSRTSGVRFRSASAQSVPLSRAGKTSPAVNNTSSLSASRGNTGTLHASSSGVLGSGGPTAERDAIEALLAMGSM